MDAKRIKALLSVPDQQDLFGNLKGDEAKQLCQCPSCFRAVGVGRLAPHLEKCGLKKQKPGRVTEDLMTCFLCKGAESQVSLMLCDGCSQVYHLWCVTPRLSTLPDGYWFCRRCGPLIVDKKLKKKKTFKSKNALDKVLLDHREPSDEIVTEFVCDACKQEVEGERWRCLECLDVDLCEGCFKKKKVTVEGHTKGHDMVKMRV